VKNPRTARARSTIVNRTVTPRRRPNADLREREDLTPKEVDRLQDAARKHSRYGHRDATAILIAYRHGLRASELCELTWNMIELDSGRIHVRRAKNGVDSTHPLTGKEIRALRQLRRENLQSRFVFNTERGGPVTRAWFLKMVLRTGKLAKLALPIHPHMLRHACGFKLANDGVDTRALQHFLGHRNIMHTVRYTELRSDRFDGFWKDCAIDAVLSMMASIPGSCSSFWATEVSFTRCGIRSCAPNDSMGSRWVLQASSVQPRPSNAVVNTRALQHFLGHRNIMHTVRYTELRSDRFDGFWKD